MSDQPVFHAFVAPAPAVLAPLFPGYDIEGLIACGGMGAVYKAVQRSLERPVAIKILPQEFTLDREFQANFVAEAKAMARLNHPNLISVYDFGDAGGMLFIIMEFVQGHSLHHAAHGTAIDPTEVIRLISGVCHGLAHAHENGIMHRDIKPANILLDHNANPKIGDFGLARPTDHKVQAGEDIFGTPHYTAPEVVHAPTTVDHRADIFSVGVMLHELLTGRLPADDPRPASLISLCDSRFDAIIRRATAPNPKERYSSALEMVRELRIIASSTGPKSPHAGAVVAPYNLHRKGKVRRVKKSSGGAAVIIIIIIAAIGAIGLKHYANQKAAAKAAVSSEQSAKNTEPPPKKPEQPNTAPEPIPPTTEAPEPAAP